MDGFAFWWAFTETGDNSVIKFTFGSLLSVWSTNRAVESAKLVVTFSVRVTGGGRRVEVRENE